MYHSSLSVYGIYSHYTESAAFSQQAEEAKNSPTKVGERGLFLNYDRGSIWTVVVNPFRIIHRQANAAVRRLSAEVLLVAERLFVARVRD